MGSGEFSSAAQLNSAFLEGLLAQLNKNFFQLSSLSSAKTFPQLSSVIFCQNLQLCWGPLTPVKRTKLHELLALALKQRAQTLKDFPKV